MQPWLRPEIVAHSQCLCQSYQHWFGEPLAGEVPPEQLAEFLFHAPFALLSHGMEPDPMLNYGNQVALNLWEMDWDAFTQMPSRLTAANVQQQGRSQLLQQVQTQGYVSDASGIRVSSTGQLFRIEQVNIWTVLDPAQQLCGQAAMFRHWQRH